MNVNSSRGVVGLAVLSLSVGCKGKPQAQGPAGMPVKMEIAQAVTIDDTTEYVASLKSRDSASIMPQVEGQITEIFVHSGERVEVGAPLMQIDPAKQQATVKSQEDTRAAKLAALDYAKRQHERVQGLFASGVASQQDLDQAKSALDAAEADLRSMEAQVREQEVTLRYHRVAAPTAGIVGDIPVRVGDRVAVTTLLTTVDKPGTLEAYVSVPVERAPQLKMGMPVRIVDSAGTTVADSRVTFVSPQADKETQTVLVKARIDNPAGTFRTSQFMRARVVWGTRQGPVVPLLAVTRISGQHFAFVAEGSEGALVARQRPLHLGEIVGNAYVVLDGIKAGERVIVSGTQFLQDGAPVTPQG